MKKITVILLALLFCISNIVKSDTLQIFDGPAYEPYKIHFVDYNKGFVCGEGGIWVTSNSGANWSLSFGNTGAYDTTNAIYDFQFCEDGTAYAVGWRGTPINDTLWTFNYLIIKSTNNGDTWSDVMLTNIGFFDLKGWKEKMNIKGANTNILFSVVCANSQIVTACGNNASVFRTTNGGVNWQESVTGWNHIRKMVYHNNILYGGQYNRLSKSTNYGNNWSFTLLDPTSTIEAIAFNRNKMFVAGQETQEWINLSYSYTTNDGVNWVTRILSDSGSFTDMMFVNQQLGYATAHNPIVWGVWNPTKGYIFKTTDGGETWEKIFEQPWVEMMSLCRFEQSIFLVGTGKVIRLDLLTGINHTGGIADEFSLKQNFPNPFNPTTKINYSVPRNSHVKVVVYNLIGQEVTTLVNEQKNVGNYSVEFNGADLSSGAYFYKLTVGNYTSVKKMMLIK